MNPTPLLGAAGWPLQTWHLGADFGKMGPCVKVGTTGVTPEGGSVPSSRLFYMSDHVYSSPCPCGPCSHFADGKAEALLTGPRDFFLMLCPWGKGKWMGDPVAGLGGRLLFILGLGNLPGLAPNLAWLPPTQLMPGHGIHAQGQAL